MPHNGYLTVLISLQTKFQGHGTLESSQLFLKIRKLFSSGQKAKGSSFWGPMAFLAHLSYISTLGELYMWRTRIRIIAQTPLWKFKHYQSDFLSRREAQKHEIVFQLKCAPQLFSSLHPFTWVLLERFLTDKFSFCQATN